MQDNCISLNYIHTKQLQLIFNAFLAYDMGMVCAFLSVSVYLGQHITIYF